MQCFSSTYSTLSSGFSTCARLLDNTFIPATIEYAIRTFFSNYAWIKVEWERIGAGKKAEAYGDVCCRMGAHWEMEEGDEARNVPSFTKVFPPALHVFVFYKQFLRAMHGVQGACAGGIPIA
jgi:hypothetical protein